MIGDVVVSNINIYGDVESLNILKALLKCQSSNIQANLKPKLVSWLNSLYTKLSPLLEEKQLTQFSIKALDLLDSLMLIDEYEEFILEIYACVEPYIVTFTLEDNPLFDELLTLLNRFIEAKKSIPDRMHLLVDNIESII